MALNTEQRSAAFALGLSRIEAEAALGAGLTLQEAAMAKATGVGPAAYAAARRAPETAEEIALRRRAMLAKMANAPNTPAAREALQRLAKEGE